MKSVFSRVSFRGSFRSYQQKVLDEADRCLADGHLHVVAAPGSGKTVLGLELIRRADAPTLILSPSVTVRQQWGERFAEFFLPEAEALSDYFSTELGSAAPIRSITYQALHAASRPDEEGEPRWAAALRDAGVGTVCLDEAHHLRSEWQKSLEELLHTLGRSVTVIALTATPPYDASPAEWERYLRVCGEIDAEIFVPELVAQKTLCPHQDYIYFSYPSEEEEALLAEYGARADAALARLRAEDLIPRAIEALGFDRADSGVSAELWEHADALCALLSLGAALGFEAPKEWLRQLLPLGRLPLCDEETAECALTFFLAHGELFGQALSERVRQILSEEGLLRGGALSLTADPALRRRMLSSIGKLESIARIVEGELASCGRGLRMLILTDHIRAELIHLIGSERRLDVMGAVPIFESVRRVCPYGTRLALLTGSLVIVPNAALGELLSLAEERGVRCTVSALGETLYSSLAADGGRTENVSLLTAALERGYIQILVGTKALLGEGWDSPCVNTLILASFVGSFMSSNQMRGRAIRADRSEPLKAANIWHLVTLLPPAHRLDFLYSADDRPLGEDYALLCRRFACFMAPSNDGERIESGIERIDLLRPPYTPERVAAINADMLARAADRRGMAQSWERALAKNDVRRLRETVRASGEIRPRAYAAATGGSALLHGVLLTAMGAACLASPPIAAYGLLLPLMGYSTVSMAGDLRRAFGNTTADKSVRRLSEALLSALLDARLLACPEATVSIERRDGGVVCALENASAREKTLFAEAMGELLSPLDNPRYLLVRTLKAFGLVRRMPSQSYACPSILGAKRETAELLCKKLEQSGDRFELIYTRSQEGRKFLLECRRAVNDARSAADVTRSRGLGGET